MLRLIFLFLVVSFSTSAQFTIDDSLRGTISEERSWWDAIHYDLSIEVDVENKSISGCNVILFQVLSQQNSNLQIDLNENLTIDSVKYGGNNLRFYKKSTSCYYIQFPFVKSKYDQIQKISIYYSGQPIEAKNPPWDGGIVWAKDEHGNDFVATACQGIGASTWWPCKDHGYDEPEWGVKISVTTPEHLMNISNGRLIKNVVNGGKRTTIWEVKNPINLYGVNFNIGKYVHWNAIYEGISDDLDMDFYVLEENLEKSKDQFKDAFRMMEAFEHWFGPYPFYEDGYKIVEVPYLGMEHQSSVTYGNGYKNGYLGKDLSFTGWGLKWDFIIIHESGHEWFANSITCKDNADMWIHESFTSYSESLFTEYFYGKKAGTEYVRGTRLNILNDKPIIGHYNVNNPGSYDMYYKGSNMLHMIRQLVNDDEKWLAFLRAINKEFYHQIVTSETIEAYMCQFLKMDLTSVFDQYLRTNQVPKLIIRKKGKNIQYKWDNCIEKFSMPIDVFNDKNQKIRIYPSTKFQKINSKHIKVSEDYYVF